MNDLPVSPTLPHAHSGRWTVVAMLGFGVMMVAALWIYWELYTRPFRALQVAIAEKYKDSSPQVIGGRHKSHQAASPKTLRIVVRVPVSEFDPTQDEAASQRRALDLAALAMEHQDLSSYQQLEVHLVQRIPEQATRQWSVSRSPEEWRALVQGPR